MGLVKFIYWKWKIEPKFSMNVNAEQMQLNHEPILSLRNLVDKKVGNQKNSSLLLLIFIPFFKTDVRKEGLVFQIAIFLYQKARGRNIQVDWKKFLLEITKLGNN